MRDKERQVEGLRRLFEKLFGEYLKKHHEFPPLRSGDLVEDTRRVNQFIGSRPEIMRSIRGLPAVQNMVVETALDVLKKMESKEK